MYKGGRYSQPWSQDGGFKTEEAVPMGSKVRSAKKVHHGKPHARVHVRKEETNMPYL